MIKAARLPFLMAAAAVAGFSLRPAQVLFREGSAEVQAVRKAYRLVQTFSRSEIDRNFLEKLDSLTPPFPAGSSYQIGDIPAVAGRFTVHKFVALYRGESAEGEKEFHDLLVIETDGAGTVLDGYHYTLEWMDSPTLDLFRVGAKGVLLRDGLAIGELKLANIRTGAPLEESGVIVLDK
jgi:hypothetical protein